MPFFVNSADVMAGLSWCCGVRLCTNRLPAVEGLATLVALTATLLCVCNLVWSGVLLIMRFYQSCCHI